MSSHDALTPNAAVNPALVQAATEFVVFAHGMANFDHNRGTTGDQERLLRSRLDPRHDFRGAFDDSGNFAFVSSLGWERLRSDVLAALREEYDIRGVVVVPRARCATALDAIERIALDRYDTRFRVGDYSLHLESGRWRLGVVFLYCPPGLMPAASQPLQSLDERHLTILDVRGDMVGVAKYDQGRRIPWGAPARLVERVLQAEWPGLLATGRSAQTVRGLLALFANRSRSRPEPRGQSISPKKGRESGTEQIGGAMDMQHPPDAFSQFESWLASHAELADQRAGPQMREAFIELARQVYRDSNGQKVPRRAGNSDKHIPFSPLGTKQNLADPRVSRGAIRLAMKIPPEQLHSVDPNLRTVPISYKDGRWKSYNRAFNFRDPGDVNFLARLISTCVTRLTRDRSSSTRTVDAQAETELDFGFVRDSKLRTVLQADWKESRTVYEARAWKSCVILCAGLVEGLLFDALGRNRARAEEHYTRRPEESKVPHLSRWPFDALVRVARALECLTFETAARCQGLRNRRNLVHTPFAAAARMEVTSATALEARATLLECYRELQARFRV